MGPEKNKPLNTSTVDCLQLISRRIQMRSDNNQSTDSIGGSIVCLFVLRFYGPVNPMGS